jgi:hypothetical protein
MRLLPVETTETKVSCYRQTSTQKDERATIYGFDSSITDDGIFIYIPVRYYELTLKNRLLDQLGAFSHLLLEAAHQFPEHCIDWVLKVTGLRFQQLQPILTRLEGLGLMKGNRLSRSGKNFSVWKRLLHDQKRLIWLDGDHRNDCFCGDSSVDTVELPDDIPFVIRRWHRREGAPRSWSCNDWNEDCERQKNRIMRHPEQYLPPIFEHFTDCFIDNGFRSHEWELTIRIATDIPGPRAIEIKLNAGDLHRWADHEYTVASPVLCLSTCYSLPAGAPERLRDQLPNDHLRITALNTSSDNIDLNCLSDTPPSTWVWPEIEQDIREQIIDSLFHEITTPDDPAEVRFNREHRIDDRWQRLGFNWSLIEQKLEAKGLHRIRGDV